MNNIIDHLALPNYNPANGRLLLYIIYEDVSSKLLFAFYFKHLQKESTGNARVMLEL